MRGQTIAAWLVLALALAPGCKPSKSAEAAKDKKSGSKTDENASLSLASTGMYMGFLPVRRAFALDAAALDTENDGVDYANSLIGAPQYAWIVCDDQATKFGIDSYEEAESAAMVGSLVLDVNGRLAIDGKRVKACNVRGPRLLPLPGLFSLIDQLVAGSIRKEDYVLIQAFLLSVRGPTMAGPFTGAPSAFLVGKVKTGYPDGQPFSMDAFMQRLKKLDGAINPCIAAKSARDKKYENWKLGNFACRGGDMSGTYTPGGKGRGGVAALGELLITAIGSLFEDTYGSRLSSTRDPFLLLLDLVFDTRDYETISGGSTGKLAKMATDAGAAAAFQAFFASDSYGPPVAGSSAGLALTAPKLNLAGVGGYTTPRPQQNPMFRAGKVGGNKPGGNGTKPGGNTPTKPDGKPPTPDKDKLPGGKVPDYVNSNPAWKEGLAKVNGSHPNGANDTKTGDIVTAGNYEPTYANTSWVQSVDKNDPNHMVFTYKDGRSESWNLEVKDKKQIWTPDAVKPQTDPNNPNGPKLGMTEVVDLDTNKHMMSGTFSTGMAGAKAETLAPMEMGLDSKTGHEVLKRPEDREKVQSTMQNMFCAQERRLGEIKERLDGNDMLSGERSRLEDENKSIKEQRERNIQAGAMMLNKSPEEFRKELAAGCGQGPLPVKAALNLQDGGGGGGEPTCGDGAPTEDPDNLKQPDPEKPELSQGDPEGSKVDPVPGDNGPTGVGDGKPGEPELTSGGNPPVVPPVDTEPVVPVEPSPVVDPVIDPE